MNDRKESQNENEVWKDVVGFEDYYEVSNTGKVRRKDHITVYKNGARARFSQTILKPSVFKKGYLMVFLSVKSKKKAKSVHRIVAEAFIPNPENKETVNHIDCDKTNNHVSNLEWLSNEENIQHSVENGRYEYRDERKRLGRRKQKGNYTSQYYGVSYDKVNNKWIMQFRYKGKKTYKGGFETEEEAAEAYIMELKKCGYDVTN